MNEYQSGYADSYIGVNFSLLGSKHVAAKLIFDSAITNCFAIGEYHCKC